MILCDESRNIICTVSQKKRCHLYFYDKWQMWNNFSNCCTVA